MTTMFVFPQMFYPHIKNSTMKIPENFIDYNQEEFPHFDIFLKSHIGFSIDVKELENNANIISGISEDKLKTITLQELIALGVTYGVGDLV